MLGIQSGAQAGGSVVADECRGDAPVLYRQAPPVHEHRQPHRAPVRPEPHAEAKNATKAALKAVNSQCALGRPIAVDLCDDKSDPNAAQQCGLEAKSNGSLALFGSSGTFTNGTNAAQLPGVFTAGGTVFDLTNPKSFSSTSGLTLVVGGAGVAAGLHKKENLLVVVDTAATGTFVADVQKVAKGVGVKVDTLFVPPNTTDYAPIAAQVSQSEPGSIGIILANPVPFINALAAEGITAKKVPILTAVTLMPPKVLHQLGRPPTACTFSPSRPRRRTAQPRHPADAEGVEGRRVPRERRPAQPGEHGRVVERARARRHPREAAERRSHV